MALSLYRPSLRALGAIGVLVAWAASLGWLGEREIGRNEATTLSSEATLRLAPAGAWYAVYAGGVQVGSAGITLDTLSPGYRIVETDILELPVGTGLERTTRRTETLLGATLGLEGVHSRYNRPGRQVEWTVSASADTIAAHSTSGAVRAQGKARFTEAPTAAAAFSYRLAMAGSLAPGRVRNLLLLGNWPIAGRASSITVGTDSMAVFADSAKEDATTGGWVAARFDSMRVYAVVVDGPTSPYRVWVDHRGAVAGMETLMGIRWARTDFELAMADLRGELPAGSSAIRGALPAIRSLYSPGATPDTTTHERRFLVEHRDGTSVDLALLALLGGGRQDVHGDTLTVREDSWPTAASRRSDAPSDPMIQDEAAAIVKFAKHFSGVPLNAGILNEMFAAIHKTVRIDTAASAPEDALGTLATHRGRPDGIVRLFVATARAAGLSARYVVGLAPCHGTLFTHAWAEVWGPEGHNGWFAVDPVFGTVPAATDLIRLAYSGSSYPEDMLPIIADARLVELNTSEIP